ncbi:MAG: hypothetical protein R3225_06025 [Halofilum sp. (in: g-proteobacteria)]|nr:hypothetical protein [Halofilum sp. (in: g-proteobacteria)]
MQQINLYQEQFHERRDPLDARHLAGALLLLLIALAAWSGWLYQRADTTAARLAVAEQRRDRAEQQVLALRAQVERSQDQQSGTEDASGRLRRELAAKRRMLDYLETGPMARRDGFSAHLAGLSRRVVDDLWFHRIVYQHGGQKLRFEGHALKAGDVPRMIAALGEEPVYAGHAFRSLVIERPEEADWRVDFVLASDAPDNADSGTGSGRRR